MNEAMIRQMMLEQKVEIETLRTMLIQRGKLNAMEYEMLKKQIAAQLQESNTALKAPSL
ncbi:hypothetical protein [Ammoniphilus sp. CFH 90114]|uniref:hypothetical protein n=1 Tax=Ammoniphilus sp. CFH 90114 TaxID=2493665 RepID=UPI0013E91A44|nr:hypothetical protein [Ammoniphilus sp. CFH 90114]